MIVTNHQPQYLPYLGFFHKVAHADHLVVLDDVQFQERGFQHRNLIKMQTGTQWLTVPVVQQRGQLIQDVAIADQGFRRKHWSALRSNYAPAPYWKPLAPGLQAILEQGGHTHLAALDLDLLRWAFDLLGIGAAITLSSTLALPPAAGPNEHHIAICHAVGADTYLSGPGGREYMDLPRYAAAGVAVEFQAYEGRPYPQRFEQHGFVPNLAVVDALFNLGPEGTRALIA